MGFDVNTLQLLIVAGLDGVRFDRTATIGRQALMLTKSDLKWLLRDLPFHNSGGSLDALLGSCGSWAEPVLQCLGAKEVTSIDSSDYEDASIIHDMNTPIGPDLEGRFDVVIDGGSLEHVFDVREAITNCLRMVKKGGHFISSSPSINACGHGFYQFGPDFFYGVLHECNGFRVERFLVFEPRSGSLFYEVPDPASCTERLSLWSDSEATFFVQARRIEEVQILTASPQQVHWRRKWESSSTGGYGKSPSPRLRWMRQCLEQVGTMFRPVHWAVRRCRDYLANRSRRRNAISRCKDLKPFLGYKVR